MNTSKPSCPYRHTITIQDSDIDVLNHVNNEVYLRWLIEAAVAHSESLGMNFEKCYELGHAFVVKRHELDYRAPALRMDSLEVHTWTDPVTGAKCLRHYELIRISDQKIILQGLTIWVFINLKTGRPTPIPESIALLYSKIE